jgi:hypothetical protein
VNTADTFKPRPLALAIAIALGASPQFGHAAAGRVQFAFGEVAVENAQGSTPLKKGAELEAGDTVVTERGRVQIKFTDGSFVSLQPQSTFKIDEYQFQAGDDGSERSFFSLFRGGLRTITGAIGRRNRDSYRVTTPVATIGIRGTEYLIKLDGSGAIVTVGDGAIAVINDAGEVILLNGQTGVIVDKSTLVQLVDEKPVLPPAPPKDNRDDPGTDDPQQDDDDFVAGLLGDDGDGGDFGTPIDDDEEPVEPAPPEPKLESGPGYAVAFAYYSDNWEGPRNSYRTDADATFVDGQLTGWQLDGGEGFSAIRDLELVEAGSDQYIGWGRWSNPDSTMREFDIDGNVDDFDEENQSLHYVAGRPTELALAAVGRSEARYEVLSFTSPTDADGNVGTFQNGTFLVDFLDQDVSGSAEFNMSGDDYDLAFADIPAALGTFVGSADVNASLGGCGCGGCNGYVSGIVSGPEAERAGFVYHVGDYDQERDIFGAVTFIQNPNGALPPSEL